MIRHLTLKDVGPARELKFAFSPRLNVLTGDNGLGKTFVLDVVWWVLTTTWAGEKAFPRRPLPKDFVGEAVGGSAEPEAELDPGITAVLTKREGETGADTEVVTIGTWERGTQEWVLGQWQPNRRTPGSVVYPEQHDEAEFRPRSLVIYARIDGSYAVFDTLYAKGGVSTFADTAIVLSPSELWRGKEVVDAEVEGGKRTVIDGLLADWVHWQRRFESKEFAALGKVLHALWPPGEDLNLDIEPIRVHRRDRRDIPAVGTPYGVVPVTLASAGMKRALSLAYLLVWAWTEHEKAAKESGQRPTRDVVLLIDEPELHQHPSWQRVFLPAVLKAIGMIAPNAAVQVFTATHSPLVLASLETVWVEALDDLFVMERDGSLVRSNEQEFVREGDVTAWLASSVFGGVSGRSRGAELATDAAQHFMADRLKEADDALALLYDHLDEQPRPAIPNKANKEDVDWPMQVTEEAYRRRPLAERVHDALKHTLPGHDEFWVHWTLVYRSGTRPKEGDDAAR